MRSWLVPSAIALLCMGVIACGKAGKLEGSASSSSPTTTTSSEASASASSVEGSRDLPPQNDDYISTYGHEAKPSLKRRITALVERYYAAALAGEGDIACSMLYSMLAKGVPEDYGSPGRPQPHGPSCGTVLPRLFKHIPGHSRADLASTKVTGVRLSSEHGFVQLSSRTMPTGEISVEREDGSWKIGVVVGRACTRCAAR
jgi:hypothetical protein